MQSFFFVGNKRFGLLNGIGIGIGTVATILILIDSDANFNMVLGLTQRFVVMQKSTLLKEIFHFSSIALGALVFNSFKWVVETEDELRDVGYIAAFLQATGSLILILSTYYERDSSFESRVQENHLQLDGLLQNISSKTFSKLWLSYLCNVAGYVYFYTTYREFVDRNFGFSDSEIKLKLSLVISTFCDLFNCVGRLFWAHVVCFDPKGL